MFTIDPQILLDKIMLLEVSNDPLDKVALQQLLEVQSLLQPVNVETIFSEGYNWGSINTPYQKALNNFLNK